MAYVVSTRSSQGTGGNLTVSLPDHVDDDVIVIFISGLNTTSLTTVPSGWLSVGSLGGSGSADNWIYYQRVGTGAAPLTDPAFVYSGSSFNIGAIAMVVRGADVTSTTSAIGANVESTSASAWSVTTGTLGSLTDPNTLILLFCSGERNSEDPFFDAGNGIDLEYNVDPASTHNILGVGYTYEQGATSETFKAVTANTSLSGIGVFALVINDDGNDVVRGYAKKGFADLVNVNLGDQGEAVSGQVDISDVSFTPQTTSITNSESSVSQTVTSDNFNNAAEGALHFLFPNNLGLGSQANSTDSPNIIVNTVELTGTVDLSSSKIALSCTIDKPLLESLDNLGRVIGFGDNTNASFFLFDGSNSTVKSFLGIQTYVFNTADTGYEIDTSGAGSLSWSSVKHIMHGFKPTNYSSVNARFGPVYKLSTMEMLGGSSTLPCSFDDCAKAAKGGALNTIRNQGGQTTGQFYSMHDIQIGDGTDDVFWRSEFEAIEFPPAYSYDNGVVQVQADAGAFSLKINVTASSTVDLDVTTLNMGNFHVFEVTSGTSTSATYSFDGCNVLNGDPTIQAIGLNTYAGISFIGCKELTINGFNDRTTKTIGAATISNCDDTYAVTVTNQDEFEALKNITFSGNNYSIRITGNHGGDTWSLAGATVSGGTGSYDIRYEGTGTLTVEVDNSSGWTQPRAEATTGTLTISSPTVTLTVNSSESGSDIKIFDTNTQTIEASATGTTASTTATGTYDLTVQKAGFLPQRQTGVTLGASSVTVDITLVADPIYASGHGLVFTTDYDYAPATRVLTIAANQEGRDLYSALIEAFISETSLRNCPFPLIAVGPDRIDFKAVGNFNSATTVGATIDSGDIQFWKGAGMEWEDDTTGNPVKKFYSIKSANTLQSGSVVGYTQVNNGTATESTLVSNQVNEVIQYYEDTNGDGTPDYNYTGHLLFKGFKDGYYQARWDVINDSGVSTLESYEYTINLLQDAIAGTTGDQGVTITTLTDHTGAPITVGGKSFDYELVDPGVNTAEDLLSQYNYDIFTAVNTLISGTIYTSYNAFDLPDLIIESGANYETERGYFEGDGAVTDLSGVYLSRSSADHPDITRFQSNDGTYYTPAVTSNISITGMPTAGNEIRLQVSNETAKTASAWAATTVYAQGSKVLRSTGLGTENTAGLYYVATTGGTSGGSEPTFPTVVGNTVSDGTVTWTCFAILYYDDDPASAGYADSYTDGEEFDTGDTYRVRFAELNTTTSFKTFNTTGIVSSTGFTVPVSATADSVYASNGVDGSSASVTAKFSPDFGNNEIDLDANQDFAATELFAYYCYELTTTQGMYSVWDAFVAIDSANYRNDVDVFSIFLDETAGFVKQTDTPRIFRSDGTRPARDPTTGGNGIEVNWKNPVYQIETGVSGLTASESTELFKNSTIVTNLATVDTNVDAILVDTSTTIPAQISGLNDLSAAQVNAEVDTALTDYDAPTKAELDAAVAPLSTFDPSTDTLEGSETYDETFRIARAALAGKASQAGTTETFRDAADTKDRITATVDTDGQRTSVTTDGS